MITQLTLEKWEALPRLIYQGTKEVVQGDIGLPFPFYIILLQANRAGTLALFYCQGEVQEITWSANVIHTE